MSSSPWENEAYLAIKELGPDKFELVTPSLSILAEPPVSVVDKVVDKRGTRKVAQAYLEFIYTTEGQENRAKHYYRPRDAKVAAQFSKQFVNVKLFTIDDVVRWLAESAENTLRRRRYVRPDLSTALASACTPACDSSAAFCPALPRGGLGAIVRFRLAPRQQSPPAGGRGSNHTLAHPFVPPIVNSTTLIIPGLYGSGSDHWQTWLEYAWAREQDDWNVAALDQWTRPGGRAIHRRCNGQVWLVAHSFGCLAAVTAAVDRADRVAGALWLHLPIQSDSLRWTTANPLAHLQRMLMSRRRQETRSPVLVPHQSLVGFPLHSCSQLKRPVDAPDGGIGVGGSLGRTV